MRSCVARSTSQFWVEVVERVSFLGSVIREDWVAVGVESRTRPRKVAVSVCLAAAVATSFEASQASISLMGEEVLERVGGRCGKAERGKKKDEEGIRRRRARNCGRRSILRRCRVSVKRPRSRWSRLLFEGGRSVFLG